MKGWKTSIRGLICGLLLMTMSLSVINAADGMGNDVEEKQTKFSDVKDTDWFAKDVMYLAELNIINGYDNHQYKPNHTLTRAQFIKIVITGTTENSIQNGKNYWASTYIEKAKALELIDSDELINATNFDSPITRGEICKIIIKALDESYEEDLSRYMNIIKDYSVIEEDYKEYVLKAYSKGILGGYSDGMFKVNNNATRAEAATIMMRFLEPDRRIDESISYANKTVNISTGEKLVKIITINPQNEKLSFEVSIPGNTLNNTEKFEKLVQDKGAFAAVNANFFKAYNKIKDPIGHIMSNGELIHGESGFTTVGITKDHQIVFSKPAVFIVGGTEGRYENKGLGNGDFEYYKWVAYEVNTRVQSENTALLYTPVIGESIDIEAKGYVISVENDIVTSNRLIDAPEKIQIPANGYIIFIGKQNADSWKGNESLKVGRTVQYKYHNISNTNPDFKWEDMKWALSGGPLLVTNGDIAPKSEHMAFSEERFTTMSTSRTAFGITADNKVLLVSVTSTTIDELKEIMYNLGCVNAVNLDGGGSTAMYYDGEVITTPGRELVTVLYVFKE